MIVTAPSVGSQRLWRSTADTGAFEVLSSADCARPERLLASDFVEIVASGRRWSGQEMIAELLESSEFGEVDI
jgi:hypothetical protein